MGAIPSTLIGTNSLIQDRPTGNDSLHCVVRWCRIRRRARGRSRPLRVLAGAIGMSAKVFRHGVHESIDSILDRAREERCARGIVSDSHYPARAANPRGGLKIVQSKRWVVRDGDVLWRSAARDTTREDIAQLSRQCVDGAACANGTKESPFVAKAASAHRPTCRCGRSGDTSAPVQRVGEIQRNRTGAELEAANAV